MSVIRKKPFIESVIDGLNATQINALQDVIDNGGSIDCSIDNLPQNYGIYGVFFRINEFQSKSGILIYTATKIVLICYNRFPELQVYDFNPSTHEYKIINEDLTIEELRRVISLKISSDISPSILASKMEGGSGVVVDLNEAETKVEVHLDMTGANPGEFLKYGSSGPVWGTPVSGTHDETNWTSLSIQGTSGLETYNVGGGGKLYHHRLSLGNGSYNISLITNASTPYTTETMANYLQEKGYTSLKPLGVFGGYTYVGVGNKTINTPVGLAYDYGTNTIGVVNNTTTFAMVDNDIYITTSGTYSSLAIIGDTVTEL